MRKNQYNLHIRLDEDERAALEKGLQASGLPLSAYLRKLILGESIQAAPSEELRRLRTEIHQIGNNINRSNFKKTSLKAPLHLQEPENLEQAELLQFP